MWLPAFKYIKGLLAQRGQFLLPSGQPYEGSYHELYNGRTFTKDIPSVDSIEIFADDSEPHLPEPTYEQKIVSEPVYPTPEDYEKGFFLRYFVKDKRNGKIIEAKSTTYKEKTKEKFLLGVDLKWILEKPVKDIFNQGYLYKGAITRNKENTKKQDLVMKGLYDFIIEYDKFVNIESDVEGYKFEELPRVEKMRIIEKVSSIQNKPKVKPKPFSSGSATIVACVKSLLILTSSLLGLIKDFQFLIFTFSVSIKLSFFLVVLYCYEALA